MPRKGQRIKTRKPLAVKPPGGRRPKTADAPLAHNRLMRYMDEHFEWMEVTGYSADTIRARRVAIRKFIAWADERGLGDPREITKPMLERYQRYLFYYRKPDTAQGGKAAGQPLSISMQYQYLAPLKTWFRWLSREHHILANPAADLDLPRQPKRLPRSTPTVQEVEAILAEAEPDNAQGLRDRALLEVLYATGLRRMELAGTAVYDADLTRGVLWVRHGKGGRERVVPLGQRAMAWLDKYLTQARPELLGADTPALFITDYGEPVRADFISAKVKRYMEFAGVHKVGAAHLLRHACATHMLEGGADIRFIQEMLGHANLQTTEIYTHVSIDKLIAVHGATHPSRLKRRRTGAEGSEAPVSGRAWPRHARRSSGLWRRMARVPTMARTPALQRTPDGAAELGCALTPSGPLPSRGLHAQPARRSLHRGDATGAALIRTENTVRRLRAGLRDKARRALSPPVLGSRCGVNCCAIQHNGLLHAVPPVAR